MQSHELSQANGNKGSSTNMVNSTASPQLVTVPVGFCLPSVDNSKMSAGMYCHDFTFLWKSITSSKHETVYICYSFFKFL
jgi:hypothetical protein